MEESAGVAEGSTELEQSGLEERMWAAEHNTAAGLDNELTLIYK